MSISIKLPHIGDIIIFFFRPALDVMARKKGLGDRILWTPLYPEDQHLAVKSLASLQLDTCVYNGTQANPINRRSAPFWPLPKP
jgi:hypothetical protein